MLGSATPVPRICYLILSCCLLFPTHQGAFTPIKEGESRSPSQYLRESKGVRHVADKDLPELPAEISTLNPIQVGIHPVDPVKEKW